MNFNIMMQQKHKKNNKLVLRFKNVSSYFSANIFLFFGTKILFDLRYHKTAASIGKEAGKRRVNKILSSEDERSETPAFFLVTINILSI